MLCHNCSQQLTRLLMKFLLMVCIHSNSKQKTVYIKTSNLFLWFALFSAPGSCWTNDLNSVKKYPAFWQFLQSFLLLLLLNCMISLQWVPVLLVSILYWVRLIIFFLSISALSSAPENHINLGRQLNILHFRWEYSTFLLQLT